MESAPQAAMEVQKFLNEVWSRLRAAAPQIPVAIVLAADSDARRRHRGLFAPHVWRARGRKRHEVSISPDLFPSTPELLATFLHEAAHAILYGHKTHPGGVGRDGYYHRKEFRIQCRKLGLECSFLSNRHGFSITTWPASGIPKQYTNVARYINRHRPLGTGKESPSPPGSRPLPQSGHVKLMCRCTKEARCIYVRRAIANDRNILCTVCGSRFQPAESPEPRTAKRPTVLRSFPGHP